MPWREAVATVSCEWWLRRWVGRYLEAWRGFARRPVGLFGYYDGVRSASVTMRQECWEEWIMSSPVGGGHAGLQAMTVCVGGVAARVLSTRSLVPDSDRQEWEGVRFNWGALPSVALRRVTGTGRGSKQERDCQSLRRKRRRDVDWHNRRADEAVEPCR
jgi:hypothetical protein